MFIPDPEIFSHPRSRVQRSKSTGSRISDPDPQHCFIDWKVLGLRDKFGPALRILKIFIYLNYFKNLITCTEYSLSIMCNVLYITDQI